MADGGWIKLYRCLLGKAAWKCCTPEQKVAMITILLLANHEPNQSAWNGKMCDVRKGQLVTTLKSFSHTAGISVQNTRTALEKLKKLGFLEYESGKDGTFINVCNWSGYQCGRTLEKSDKTVLQEVEQKSTHDLTQELTQELTQDEYTENVENTTENANFDEEVNTPVNTVINTQTNTPVNTPSNTRLTHICKKEKKEKKYREDKERVKREKPPTDPAGIFEVSDDLELEQLGLLPETAEKTREWIRFKHERDEPVTESQLRNLVSEIKTAETKYGAEKVCSLISQSMASGYKGIPFDRLENRRGKGRSYMDAIDDRYDVVDSWLTMAERGDFGEVGICDTG